MWAYLHWRCTQVAKGPDCKSVIRGFESPHRLHLQGSWALVSPPDSNSVQTNPASALPPFGEVQPAAHTQGREATDGSTPSSPAIYTTRSSKQTAGDCTSLLARRAREGLAGSTPACSAIILETQADVVTAPDSNSDEP